MGCTGLLKDEGKRWVQVMGLPIHAWCLDLFKSIGDFCGGYVSMEADWEKRWDRVRMLVKHTGTIPNFVEVCVLDDCYRVQVIEELPPQLMPIRSAHGGQKLINRTCLKENKLTTGVHERNAGRFHQTEHRMRGRRWVGTHAWWRKVEVEGMARPRVKRNMVPHMKAGENSLYFEMQKDHLGDGV